MKTIFKVTLKEGWRNKMDEEIMQNAIILK